eukprot:6517006-Pyramimonas_sp.AAC.1
MSGLCRRWAWRPLCRKRWRRARGERVETVAAGGPWATLEAAHVWNGRSGLPFGLSQNGLSQNGYGHSVGIILGSD